MEQEWSIISIFEKCVEVVAASLPQPFQLYPIPHPPQQDPILSF